MVHWLVTGAALALAVAAPAMARGLTRRLERLTRHYWELRNQHGELRAQLRRLDPGAAPDEAPASPLASGFIPLSALNR